MQNTDGQLKEILRRSEIINKKSMIRKRIIGECAAICACIAICIVVAVIMAARRDFLPSPTEMYYGSLILKTSYMGYVVIGAAALAAGILAFVLYRNAKELKQL